MIKGNNVAHLNESTIMAALQYYFDTVTFREGQAPLVVGVKYLTSNGTFEVVLNSTKEEPISPVVAR